VADRTPPPVSEVVPTIPIPNIAVPHPDEIPFISIPLARLAERLPRTGGEPVTFGLRIIVSAALMGFGSFLMLRRR
jgi:hypothetical protein